MKCRHRPPTNRKLVEKEPKKPQHLFDDFLEIGVFDICNLTGRRKKMAEWFMDKVLTSVEKGSYDLLLHILKTEMCNVPHVYQRIVEELEKTPDQSGLIFFIHTIRTVYNFKPLISSNFVSLCSKYMSHNCCHRSNCVKNVTCMNIEYPNFNTGTKR